MNDTNAERHIQTHAQRCMTTAACTQMFEDRRMHTDACTHAHAQRCLTTGACTQMPDDRRMHTHAHANNVSHNVVCVNAPLVSSFEEELVVPSMALAFLSES